MSNEYDHSEEIVMAYSNTSLVYLDNSIERSYENQILVILSMSRQGNILLKG